MTTPPSCDLFMTTPPSCNLFMTTPPLYNYVTFFDCAYIWCISTAPSDYTAVREVLVFPPSLSNQILPLRIPISNDLVYEGGAETFSVRLEIPSEERGVSAGLQNTAIVTIEEDGMTRDHALPLWCHVMPFDVVWCHGCHVMPFDVIWCHVMSCDVINCNVSLSTY